MRFPIVVSSLVALLTAVACAAPADESDAQTDDLVTSAWTEDQAQSGVNVAVQGSGEVPVGSSCAPGQQSFTLNMPTQTVYALECAGTPLRMRGRTIKPSDDQWTALIAAARSVRASANARCDTDTPTPFASMTVYPTNGATFSGRLLLTDRAACVTPIGTYGEGIEKVVGVLTAMTAGSPLPPPTVFTTPPVVPPSVWTPGLTRFNVAFTGSGTMPEGSSCIPNTKSYSLQTPSTGAWSVMTSVCEPMPNVADGRFSLRTKSAFQLSDVDTSTLRTLLTNMRVAPTASCDPAADYAVLTTTQTTGGDAGPTNATATYRSNRTACTLGVDYAPYIDLEPLRRTLEQLHSGLQ